MPVDWLEQKLQEILLETQANGRALTRLSENLAEQSTTINQKLDKILSYLEPGPAAGFFITVTKGEKIMAGKAKATAGVDLQLNDNGTATATLTFEDADGVVVPAPVGLTPPAWAASDATPGPSALVLTPSADGLSCAIAPVQPPVQPLATGLTVSATVASGLAGQTSPITETSQGIDIVAGPAASFAIGLSEP
jgi:hypothetical protein